VISPGYFHHGKPLPGQTEPKLIIAGLKRDVPQAKYSRKSSIVTF